MRTSADLSLRSSASSAVKVEQKTAEDAEERRERTRTGHLPPSHELAECQKREKVKRFLPSGTPLRPPRQLAEWVIFPEENTVLGYRQLLFGGGGRLNETWRRLERDSLHLERDLSSIWYEIHPLIH
jgi:hypothetical protein